MIVPIATAIATIVATVVPVLRSNRKIVEELKDIKVDTKRLIMHDDQCSLEERLRAGDDYLNLGGNGVSKIYYESLIKKYKDERCDG